MSFDPWPSARSNRRPRAHRVELPRALDEAGGLGGQTAAAVVPDRRVVDPEADAQPQRLRKVTGGDLNLVPARAELRDHRSHHQHVG